MAGVPDAVDELLDAYIAAWHAGAAPSAAACVAQAPASSRDELEALLAAFLELAPSVPVTDQALAAHGDDPLVAELVAREHDWWNARRS